VLITQAQYSLLVAAIIASAVIPTSVANQFFLPRHHVERATAELQVVPAVGGE
jgi:glutathione-regulated potassium-efflux system ancillary protein KefC